MPATGPIFAASIIALVGLPPFSLFVSEVLLLRAGWMAGHPALTGLVLVVLLLALGALARHGQQMTLGACPDDVTAGEPERAGAAVLVLPLVALVWIGTWLPLGAESLLTRAAEILHP